MQSMSAFVAQNMGAQKSERAKKALGYGIITALAVGFVMSYFAFWQGDCLSAIFSKEADVIAASHNYLKAYAIDCILTPFYSALWVIIMVAARPYLSWPKA